MMNMTDIQEYIPKTIEAKTLSVATETIHKLRELGEMSQLAIAVTMTLVEREKLYEQGGFKNVVEYAKDNFNYKKSMTYALIKVGKRYFNENGEILPLYKDFSYSALSELTRASEEQVTKWISDGEISAESTTKEIRKQVSESKEVQSTGKTVVYDVYRKTYQSISPVGRVNDVEELINDEMIEYSIVKSPIGCKIFFETKEYVGMYICTRVEVD